MPTTNELRRCRRLHIGKLVAGKIVPSGVPIKIVDISVGGVAMETSFPVRLGATLNLQFTSKDGSSFVVKAKVAHNRRIAAAVGPVFYRSGLEFADKQTSSSHEAVTILLEKVNWILSFYDENREVPTPAVRRRTTTNGRIDRR
jgi:PilZ domain